LEVVVVFAFGKKRVGAGALTRFGFYRQDAKKARRTQRKELRIETMVSSCVPVLTTMPSAW